MSSNNDIAVVSRDREKTIVRTSVVGIILTGIGVYSYNTSDDEAAQMRNAIQKMVLSHDWALQMHGFYADTEKKTIVFVTHDLDEALLLADKIVFMVPKGIHSVIDVGIERPRNKETLMLDEEYRRLRGKLVKLFNHEQEENYFTGGAGI